MRTDLELVIVQGEGQRVEFKERPSRLDREIVAFANASGGAVFLGVADNGKVKGIDVTNELMSRIQDLARNCDPPVSVSLHKHGGKVLEVRIEEGNEKPYQCSDGFFLRNGPNTQKLRRKEILEIAIAAGTHHFDEIVCSRFRYPDDFDSRTFSRFLELCGIASHANNERILLSLDVAELQGQTLYMRQAGVLFFAREPQRFLKESMVTCVRYQGTDRFKVIDRAEIHGNPIVLIEESLKFVQRNINVQYEVTGDAQHRELYTYPLAAAREAIINAVMHRDYSYDTSHVYVQIFADRLEVENPGGLPPGLTLEDLGRRSIRRNRTIADLLYRARFVERIGSGMQRMEQALMDNGNPPMEISATNFFLVRFYPRVPLAMALPLTLRQNRLYQYARERGLITKADGAELLGVSGDTALREIRALMEKGLLTRTGTGKGTKYILNRGSD